MGHVPKGLRAAMRRATHRGLEFLVTVIDSNGAWPAIKRPIASPLEPGVVDSAPFSAGLGVLALAACNDPRSHLVRHRTLRNVVGAMEMPGVWRWWDWLPPDADSVAICSLAVGLHPWLLASWNVDLVLANRDSEGRFLTWLWSDPTIANDVDSVVNANVVAWLGQSVDTTAAQRWLESLLSDGQESRSIHYYPDVMDLYVAIVRANARVRPGLDALRPILASRIRARRDTQGGYGDSMRTAQALSCLKALGERAVDPLMSLELLMARQEADGGWPECSVWRGPPPPEPAWLCWMSRLLPTACCIETLASAAADDLASS